jgi:Ni2+-binding GTPase involved in maturation of urease and hydrogenase
MMPQWKVTLATTKKKPRKNQGHSMTLAVASVITKMDLILTLTAAVRVNSRSSVLSTTIGIFTGLSILDREDFNFYW